MRVYCVTDDKESEEKFFPNKKEAFDFFRNVVSWGSVSKMETVEPTKQGVVSMLNREQYAISSEVIASK